MKFMRFRACRPVVGFEPAPLSAFHHTRGVQQQREKSLEQAGKIAFFHYMDFVKTHFVYLCLHNYLFSCYTVLISPDTNTIKGAAANGKTIFK